MESLKLPEFKKKVQIILNIIMCSRVTNVLLMLQYHVYMEWYKLNFTYVDMLLEFFFLADGINITMMYKLILKSNYVEWYFYVY